MASRRDSVSTTLGASSITFWWRRWMEHSRSYRCTTLPCSSAKIWISICLGSSMYFSTNTAPFPKLLVASLTARSIWASNSSGLCTIRIPFPPPPALALIIIGNPISEANSFARSTSVTSPSEPGTRGTSKSATAAFALSLSPMIRMACGRGPTNIIPACSTASAKAAFSLRNP